MRAGRRSGQGEVSVHQCCPSSGASCSSVNSAGAAGLPRTPPSGGAPPQERKGPSGQKHAKDATHQHGCSLSAASCRPCSKPRLRLRAGRLLSKARNAERPPLLPTKTGARCRLSIRQLSPLNQATNAALKRASCRQKQVGWSGRPCRCPSSCSLSAASQVWAVKPATNAALTRASCWCRQREWSGRRRRHRAAASALPAANSEASHECRPEAGQLQVHARKCHHRSKPHAQPSCGPVADAGKKMSSLKQARRPQAGQPLVPTQREEQEPLLPTEKGCSLSVASCEQ